MSFNSLIWPASCKVMSPTFSLEDFSSLSRASAAISENPETSTFGISSWVLWNLWICWWSVPKSKTLMAIPWNKGNWSVNSPRGIEFLGGPSECLRFEPLSLPKEKKSVQNPLTGKHLHLVLTSSLSWSVPIHFPSQGANSKILRSPRSHRHWNLPPSIRPHFRLSPSGTALPRAEKNDFENEFHLVALSISVVAGLFTLLWLIGFPTSSASYIATMLHGLVRMSEHSRWELFT